MTTQDKKWMTLGSIIIFIFSCLLFFANIPSVWAPWPLHMFVLASTLKYLSFFVMPGLFLLQFTLTRNKQNYGKGLLLICIIISLLNLGWFLVAWDYGYKYQGILHTKVVAIENLVGFSFVIILTSLGVFKKNKKIEYIANIGLFILLSWFAFPYLGELP